jgi:hypothetical protein
MEIDFTPTAFTVKDPGNGNARRYDHDTQVAADARQAFKRAIEEWPALAALVVPDHYVQTYCRAADNASWSGHGMVSRERERTILLDLLEREVIGRRFS